MLYSLVPITEDPFMENAVEDIEDVVSNFDSLSHTSAFYEPVNEPNPAYHQYRKQSESIPIGMMKPKHTEQVVKNAVFDVSAPLPDEIEPITLVSFMPGSDNKIKHYKDETIDDVLYSTADDALYSSADKERKPITGSKEKPATPAVAEGDKEPPIYAVPIKKNSRIIKPEQGIGEKSTKPSDQWVIPEVGSAQQQDGSPDMSIFVSKSQSSLDTETPDVPPFNDTDEVFDDMFNVRDSENQPKRLGRFENRGSIMSTTSDDRDLLRPDVKLHDHPKILHHKPNLVSAVKAKFTSSPRTQPAYKQKSIAPSSQDKSKAPKTRVKRFSQPQQTSSKPPIANKPKVDPQFLQASPKLKPTNSHLSAMASNQQSSGRASPNLRLHPKTSQGNPLLPLKDRSSPRVQRKGVSVDSALQEKQVTQKVPQQGKSQTQLTQAHLTSTQQANPLQLLVAKSSPRVKPKSIAAFQQVTPVSQINAQQKRPEIQLQSSGAATQGEGSPLQPLRAKSSPRMKPREIHSHQQSASPGQVAQVQSSCPPATSSQQQSMTNSTSEAQKRSSIATELASTSLSKPTEKQRPKSAGIIYEDSKTANVTRNTDTTLSFKDKRKQEEKDLDDTFKDFADFLTTI